MRDVEDILVKLGEVGPSLAAGQPGKTQLHGQ